MFLVPSPSLPSTISSRRQIPRDVILAILAEECDPTSLAVLCTVSFELLHLAGPLLYRQITIDSFQMLFKLFYQQVSVDYIFHENHAGAEPSLHSSLVQSSRTSSSFLTLGSDFFAPSSSPSLPTLPLPSQPSYPLPKVDPLLSDTLRASFGLSLSRSSGWKLVVRTHRSPRVQHSSPPSTLDASKFDSLKPDMKTASFVSLHR
ncbi:hypothetical protein BDY24DRAFT_378823 [Mrakia frigida]|uniref:uncharacterized protein n=1 Tax=Mrakia frigida TaxID=29902 RepID=UPI003FCC1B95